MEGHLLLVSTSGDMMNAIPQEKRLVSRAKFLLPWHLNKGKCFPKFWCLRQTCSAHAHLGMAVCLLQQNCLHTAACPRILQGSQRLTERRICEYLYSHLLLHSWIYNAAKTSVLCPPKTVPEFSDTGGADNSEPSWLATDFSSLSPRPASPSQLIICYILPYLSS